jgi:YVTN family beta-propeller protein
MRRIAVVLLVLAGCHPRVRPPPPLPPLAQDGEAYLYLQPFPDDAARLAFSITGIEAIRSDGTAEPLELTLGDANADTVRSQRLLGWARLSPGAYGGFQVTFSRATLRTDQGVADLLASKEPIRIDLPFTIVRGRGLVLQLSLRPGQARDRAFAFSTAFAGAPLRPEDTLIQLATYGSSAGAAGLFVVNRRARQVSAVIPTGREPQGIALDAASGRAFVALAGEDQIQVLDLTTGEELRRIALRSGDQPQDAGLTPDGRTLVVLTPGSNSVAFVDPVAGLALDRVPVGDEPWSLLLDRSGRRAYVLNRRSSNLTVVDVANRGIIATVATDPEPLRAQLNRDATRLYVVHRGSAYMNVYSVPDMALVARMFVGLGASALKVDPRTDLVYVGRGDEDRIQLFDPSSLLPVDSIDVPGAVTYLAIDDVENVLLAVLAAPGRVGFVDLTRKRLLSTVDVGRAPFRVAPISERF